MGNVIKNMSETIGEYFVGPLHNPTLNDICPELPEMRNKTFDIYNKLNRNFVNNFDILESELSKQFYDQLFRDFGNIYDSSNLKNFSDRFKNFVKCAEYFYVSDVGSLNRDSLVNKMKNKYSANTEFSGLSYKLNFNLYDNPRTKRIYDTMGHVSYQTELGYNGDTKFLEEVTFGKKLISDIKDEINNMKGGNPNIFNNGMQGGQFSVKNMVERCYPHDNVFNENETKRFAKYYCYGYAYDLGIYMIQIVQNYYALLVFFLINKYSRFPFLISVRENSTIGEWEYNYHKNKKKWWNVESGFFHSKLAYSVIADWRQYQSNFESMKNVLRTKKQNLISSFNNMKAISYKLDHIDYQILGCIPNNSIIRNNDCLKLKVLRNGNDIDNDGTEITIKLGDFGFTNWTALGNKIQEKLPPEISIRTILPPSRQELTNNNDIDIHTQEIHNLFHNLGGFGNNRNYDNKVALFLESKVKFKILRSELNSILKIADFDIESRFNSPDDLNYVGETKVNLYCDDKIESIKTIPAPGPYYIILGPFETHSSEIEQISRIAKNNFLNNHMENYISSSFRDLGYNVLNNERFRANQQPAQ